MLDSEKGKALTFFDAFRACILPAYVGQVIQPPCGQPLPSRQYDKASCSDLLAEPTVEQYPLEANLHQVSNNPITQ